MYSYLVKHTNKQAKASYGLPMGGFDGVVWVDQYRLEPAKCQTYVTTQSDNVLLFDELIRGVK